MQDVGGASTAADTSNTATPAADLLLASAPTATSDQQPTGLSELKQQQGQLAQQITDMAAAQKGLQQQLSALQDGKADRGGVRDMLAEGLAGKADAAAVNQLKAQLGDKADRSELDALMNAMAAGSSSSGMDGEPSSSGAGSADAADGASTATAAGDAQQPESGHASSSTSSEQPAADGGAPRADVGGSRRSTREQGGAGDMAQQLSKLQLQLAVLQDRLNKKVGVALNSSKTASKHTHMGNMNAYARTPFAAPCPAGTAAWFSAEKCTANPPRAQQGTCYAPVCVHNASDSFSVTAEVTALLHNPALLHHMACFCRAPCNHHVPCAGGQPSCCRHSRRPSINQQPSVRPVRCTASPAAACASRRWHSCRPHLYCRCMGPQHSTAVAGAARCAGSKACSTRGCCARSAVSSSSRTAGAQGVWGTASIQQARPDSSSTARRPCRQSFPPLSSSY